MSATSGMCYCDVCGGLVSSADVPDISRGEDVGLLCEVCLQTRRVLPEGADDSKAEKRRLQRFRCPHCDRRLRTKLVRARVEIDCPKCKGALVLLPSGAVEAGAPTWPTAPGHERAPANLGPSPSDLTDAIDAGAFDALGASDSGAHRAAPRERSAAPPPVETVARASRGDSSSSGRSERPVTAARRALEAEAERRERESEEGADEEDSEDEAEEGEGDGTENETENEENEDETESQDDDSFDDSDEFAPAEEGVEDGEVEEGEDVETFDEPLESFAPPRASRALITLALLAIVTGLGGAFAARSWDHPPALVHALGDRIGAGFAHLEGARSILR